MQGVAVYHKGPSGTLHALALRLHLVGMCFYHLCLKQTLHALQQAAVQCRPCGLRSAAQQRALPRCGAVFPPA
jgi:hypothetical protein